MKKVSLILLFLIVSCSIQTPKTSLQNVMFTSSEVNVEKVKDPLIGIIEKLMLIETNGVDLVGDGGRALGCLQIHPIAVKEYNLTYGTDYKHKQMMDKETSVEVCIGLLNKGIDMYKKKYSKEPSEEDIVRMWNGGIYDGYKKQSTKKYWKRYKNLC